MNYSEASYDPDNDLKSSASHLKFDVDLIDPIAEKVQRGTFYPVRETAKTSI